MRRWTRRSDPIRSRAVVVGGGYIGLELAEALVRRGLEVSVVCDALQPMSTLDPDMGALVADALRAIGISLHLETSVEAFEVDDGHVRAVLAGDERFPADLVILGIGVRPGSQLAADAGIAVGVTHGIVVDDHQRTSVDGIFAAGDCVETFHRVSRRPVAIALGTHANKQGRVAGINAAGGDAVVPGRDRHGDLEDLRVRGRTHRPQRAGGAARPASTPSRSRSRPRPGPTTTRARRRCT